MTKSINSEDYFYDGTHYISKGAYYKNSTFLIYPTWEEVNRKILIPGDRWHPFCPTALPPWQIRTFDGENIIPFRNINYTINALEKYHVLLGKKILLMNLFQHPSLIQENLMIPVMDMGCFYERHDFEVGDAIRIHVLDYQEGLYAAEYVNRSEQMEMQHKEDSWLSLMEESMEKVISLFGDKLILPRQVDWAFFLGGWRLLKYPVLNIRHFLDSTNLFTLAEDKGVYFLKKK